MTRPSTGTRWQPVLQLLQLLQLLHRHARHRRPATPSRTPVLQDAPELPDDDDRPLGCGWFDSSHDLQHGLQVREDDPQLLAQLPLADWLAFQVTPRYEADTTLDAGTGMIADLTLH